MPNNEVTPERLDALAVAGENGAIYLADGDTTEISTDCGLVARELQRLRAVVAGIVEAAIALLPASAQPPVPVPPPADPLAKATAEIRRMYLSTQGVADRMRESLEAEGLEPSEETEWDEYAALRNQETALAIALRVVGSPGELEAELRAGMAPVPAPEGEAEA